MDIKTAAHMDLIVMGYLLPFFLMARTLTMCNFSIAIRMVRNNIVLSTSY